DLGRDPHHPFWQAQPSPERFLDSEYLDREMFDDAQRLIRAVKGDKFFLMMWNYSTHLPYYADSGPDFDESQVPRAVLNYPELRTDFKRFLWSIHQIDALIFSLYGELERQGIADDTLVVLTSDHGEAFGQHGCLVHGDSLYEEEVRVPLVLINPRLGALGGHN